MGICYHLHTTEIHILNHGVSNSCNIGTSDLPDTYAQSPMARGHTYEANHECLHYVTSPLAS